MKVGEIARGGKKTVYLFFFCGAEEISGLRKLPPNPLGDPPDLSRMANFFPRFLPADRDGKFNLRLWQSSAYGNAEERLKIARLPKTRLYMIVGNSSRTVNENSIRPMVQELRCRTLEGSRSLLILSTAFFRNINHLNSRLCNSSRIDPWGDKLDTDCFSSDLPAGAWVTEFICIRLEYTRII